MIKPNSPRNEVSNKRRTVRLRPELDKSLSAYASAAIAAGVGLLAIAKSAEAKIIYTPADIPIPVNGGPVFVDLNHDGNTDFIFSNLFRTPSSDGFPSFATLLLSASGNMRNQVWGRGRGSSHGRTRFASALEIGFTVGANKSHFQKSPTALMGQLVVDYGPEDRKATNCSTWSPGCESSTQGQWMYTKHRYLGLQFTIKGEIHYGWARVTVTRAAVSRGKNSIAATLTGYAYETIPNKAIITGKTKGPDVITLEPATVGHLAQGASGIPAWREKK
jgi:hypothetical protein